MKRIAVIIYGLIFGVYVFAGDFRIENDTDSPYFIRLNNSETPIVIEEPNKDLVISLLKNWANRSFYVSPGQVVTIDKNLLLTTNYLLACKQKGNEITLQYLALHSNRFNIEEKDFFIICSEFHDFYQYDKIVKVNISEIIDILPVFRVDGSIEEWSGVPFVLRNGDNLLRRVIKLSKGIESGISYESALTKDKAGTNLDFIKMKLQNESLHGLYAAKSIIARGLSLVFRIREEEYGNNYTIEVPVWQKGGPVFLWKEFESQPQVIGNYVSNGPFLEYKIDLNQTPELLKNHLQKKHGEIGVSLLWSEAEFGEEWDYGSMPNFGVFQVEK
jgi:hypothetical protein